MQIGDTLDYIKTLILEFTIPFIHIALLKKLKGTFLETFFQGDSPNCKPITNANYLTNCFCKLARESIILVVEY